MCCLSRDLGSMSLICLSVFLYLSICLVVCLSVLFVRLILLFVCVCVACLLDCSVALFCLRVWGFGEFFDVCINTHTHTYIYIYIYR